jgi:hypothetical protein
VGRDIVFGKLLFCYCFELFYLVSFSYYIIFYFIELAGNVENRIIYKPV